MNAPLIILGSGMAGLGLARRLRARQPDRPITLITADSGDDYAKPLLSTGFAKGLAPDALAARTPLDAADALGVVMRTHTRVEALDPAARELYIGCERLAYDELVIATGGAPQPPFAIDAPLKHRRVFTINDLDDYRAFHAALAALGRPARVAIVGAGLVGCEYANDLAAGGHAVALVAPESAPLARLLPEPLGQALAGELAAAGIELHLGRSVATLERDGGDLRLALGNGHGLDADLVLVATGLAPRSELARRAEVGS